MSDTAATFLDLFLRGEASLDEIDDYIDRWHDGDAEKDLAAYLGMTDEEYSKWLAHPELLATIAQARRGQKAVVP